MKCPELAGLVERLQPDATAQENARLCLLLATAVDDPQALRDEAVLNQTWQNACLRVQAATDQHAAMTMELEALAQSDPKQFSQDQVWVLIRAIKVQSQILEMYIGEPALDV